MGNSRKLSLTDTMIEAAAISLMASCNPLPWKDIGDSHQDDARKIARDALEAALAQQAQICGHIAGDGTPMTCGHTLTNHPDSELCTQQAQPEMPTREKIADAIEPSLWRHPGDPMSVRRNLALDIADGVSALFAPEPSKCERCGAVEDTRMGVCFDCDAPKPQRSERERAAMALYATCPMYDGGVALDWDALPGGIQADIYDRLDAPKEATCEACIDAEITSPGSTCWHHRDPRCKCPEFENDEDEAIVCTFHYAP